jgi:hypothetical protein
MSDNAMAIYMTFVFLVGMPIAIGIMAATLMWAWHKWGDK